MGELCVYCATCGEKITKPVSQVRKYKNKYYCDRAYCGPPPPKSERGTNSGLTKAKKPLFTFGPNYF